MTAVYPESTEPTSSSVVSEDEGGSTSNMLLPRIGSALLPAFITVGILAGGTCALNSQAEPPISVPIYHVAPSPVRPAPNEDTAQGSLPELAKSVRSLHARSGLTWSELAPIFGVSRRTLYNWSTGSHVSSMHARAIAAVVNAIYQIDAGSPQLTRSRLLAPAEDGSTLYAKLIQWQPRKQSMSGPAHRPSELMSNTPDTADPTGKVVDFEHMA